jgi:hypothetical protein
MSRDGELASMDEVRGWGRRGEHSAGAVRDRLIDIAVLLFCVAPLLLTAHLPLSDLPNHLARQYVLRDWASSPYLQQFYTYHWMFVPNLALELFVLAIRDLVPIDLAVRIFCIATVALLFVGTRSLNLRISGGASRIYRVAPLLCYGGPFQFGFLNFCFGVACCLLLFSLYLRMRGAHFMTLIAVFVIGGFGLLLCHVAAFGLFALAVGFFELSEAFASLRRISLPAIRESVVALLQRELRAAAFLLPPFLIFLRFSPTAEPGGAVVWSTLQQKAESIAAVTLFSSAVPELGLLLFALLGLVAAFASGAVRLHRSAFPILIAMICMWLLLPRSVLGGGYVDYRVPWAISFFLLGMLLPSTGRPALAFPLQVWFSALVIFRIALIAWLWLSWEPVIARIDAALRHLPPGARLMVVQGHRPSTSAGRRPSLLHVAAYAVARRQAFEPSLYASISGQILSFQPSYLPLQQFTSPEELRAIDPRYNYLLVIDPESAKLAPQLPLTEIDAGRQFALFSIDRLPTR